MKGLDLDGGFIAGRGEEIVRDTRGDMMEEPISCFMQPCCCKAHIFCSFGAIGKEPRSCFIQFCCYGAHIFCSFGAMGLIFSAVLVLWGLYFMQFWCYGAYILCSFGAMGLIFSAVLVLWSSYFLQFWCNGAHIFCSFGAMGLIYYASLLLWGSSFMRFWCYGHRTEIMFPPTCSMFLKHEVEVHNDDIVGRAVRLECYCERHLEHRI